MNGTDIFIRLIVIAIAFYCQFHKRQLAGPLPFRNQHIIEKASKPPIIQFNNNKWIDVTHTFDLKSFVYQTLYAAYGQVWHYKVLWMICSPNDGIDGFYFFRLTRSIWPFDNNPVSTYFHWTRALEIKRNLASKRSIWGDPIEKKWGD